MKPHSILLFFSLCISTMFARANVASEVLPHFNSQELSLREDIMGIRQSADVYPLLHLGGMYENRYSYDKQYRLIEAQGRGDFTFDFKATYSTTGKLGEKHITSNTLNGDLIFGYDNKSLRHQPQLVYSPGMDITGCLWDANGNMAQVINQQRNVGRFYEWDEENRLRFVLGEKFAGYYGYDANGERVYKIVGFSSIDQVNSGYTKAQVFFDDAVLYPNPYMVVTARGYTKHYYAGTERLATVIGQGGFGDRIVPTDELSPSEVNTIIKPFYDAYKGYDPFLHADVLQKPLTAIDITGQEFGVLAKQVIVEVVEVQAKEDILLGSIKHDAFINAEEGAVFFTHSDHLGSAAWITNENGKCIQYIHYAPFGELIDNQRVDGYDERFKFTGKERDEESGYDYFGARYYTSNLSMWLSVDPLADKYPNISPYAYCAWNPMKYVDPDGREIYVAGNFISCFLGRIGVNNFQGKVYRALDRLKDIDPDIHKMILQLEASNITYTIKPTSERSDGGSGNAYNPKTKTIYFDPDNAVKKSGEVRDPIVGLAHELGHAEDDDNGQVMIYNKDNALKGDATEQEKLNKIEKNAIMRENTVREKLNLQKRNETYIE